MSQTKAQLIDNLVSPITGALGSAAAPTFSFTADLNTGLYSPGADQLAFATGGTGRLFIDSSGRLLVGTSTARSNFFGTTLSSLTQTEGIGGSTARGSLSVINNDVSNNPPYVLLGRSGAATLGSNAAVVSGSRLGTLTFHGADGASFIEAATVAGEVDGTPGSNDMPGRLVFSTTSDGAASPTERFRIGNAGQLGIGGATYGTSGQVLTSGGASAAPTWSAASGGITSGTAVASTSGTSIDFTGLPAGVKRVMVMFNGVSTSGTSPPQIQIGDSGGIENSGYLTSNFLIINASSPVGAAFTVGFGIGVSTGQWAATVTVQGAITLSLLSSSTNTWVVSGLIGRNDINSLYVTSGSKSLSDVLTQLRITTVNGTDTFDAGSINIQYES